MEFFSVFPRLDYRQYSITDLTKRVYIPQEIKDNIDYFDIYRVKDGEKIEDLAYKFYGSPFYNWVIILMNDIIDPFYDWILTDEEIIEYCRKKYGNENKIVGYRYNGIFYKTMPPNVDIYSVEQVTAFQYESELNEQKREIKILKPDYIPLIEDEIIKQLEG